jgi:hypothetical protein
MKELLFFAGMAMVYLAYFLLAIWYDSVKARKTFKARAGNALPLTYREDTPVQKASLCYPSLPEDDAKASTPLEPGRAGNGPALTMKQYQEQARQEAERFMRSRGF